MIKPRLIEGWIILRGINVHPVGKAIRFVNTYLLNETSPTSRSSAAIFALFKISLRFTE